MNTYQVAISSNGTHSYVELLYPENGVQWIQGESHPNGLPDAKAQAGLMSEGRMYTLKGSGTDQIQNVDKWVTGYLFKVRFILSLTEKVILVVLQMVEREQTWTVAVPSRTDLRRQRRESSRQYRR